MYNKAHWYLFGYRFFDGTTLNNSERKKKIIMTQFRISLLAGMFGALYSPFLLAPAEGCGPFGSSWKPLASNSSWSTNNLHYNKIATTVKLAQITAIPSDLIEISCLESYWIKNNGIKYIVLLDNMKITTKKHEIIIGFFNSISGHQRGSGATWKLFYYVRQVN